MNLLAKGQPILAVCLFYMKQKSVDRLPKTASSRKDGEKENFMDGSWNTGVLYSVGRLHHYKCLYLFRFTTVITEGWQNHIVSCAITDFILLCVEGDNTVFIKHLFIPN